MFLIFGLKFLLFNIYSSLSNEQPLIINPIISNKSSNIVNYTFILQFNNNLKKEIANVSKIISVKQNIEKIYYNSYIFGFDFFICTTLSNQNFLIMDKKYFTMTTQTGKYSFLLKKNLTSNQVYIGYISRIITGTDGSQQIIFFGKKANNNICFNKLDSDKALCLILENYDGYVSCKFIEIRLYFCAYSVIYYI